MKHRKIIDKVLGWLVTALMGVLLITVLWQVFSRLVVGDPSAFTDELAGFLLIWVGLLGAAYVTGQKQHLAIDLISARLSVQKKKILDTVINSLIALFAIVVLIGGGANLVFITFYLNQTSSVLMLPVGYVYTVLPLSGVFITYFVITEMQLIWRKPAM